MDKSNFGTNTVYDTCNLACTDPLANPDCTQKVGHPDLLSLGFRQSQKYLCAVSLEHADLQSQNLHRGCT